MELYPDFNIFVGIMYCTSIKVAILARKCENVRNVEYKYERNGKEKELISFYPLSLAPSPKSIIRTRKKLECVNHLPVIFDSVPLPIVGQCFRNTRCYKKAR